MCFCLPNVSRKRGAKRVSRLSLRGTSARATVEGAGELLRRSDLSPAELREKVTSPNGTTAAALAVLMGQDATQELLTRAVAAAAKRSKELSS